MSQTLAPDLTLLNWSSTQDVDIPKQAKDCLARTDWNALCHYASHVFAGQPCTLLPIYTMGGTRLARLLEFEDGTRWVARVSQRATPCTPETGRRMQVEVDTMALLRARTQAPVPQIYAYEVADGEDNPVGVPFVLMEYLPGNIALLEAQRHEMGDRFGSIPVPFRQAFHASLAVAHVQITSARLPQIGTVVRAADGSFTVGPLPGIGGPFDTAAAFFHAWAKHVHSPITERYLREYCSTPPEIIDEVLQGVDAFPSRLASLAAAAAAADDRPENETGTHGGTLFTAPGPFPIRHADFWHSNVVVTPAFALLGIIDWEGACSVPWELVDAPPFLNTLPVHLSGGRTVDGRDAYDGETGEPLEEDTRGRWAQRRAYVAMVRRAEEEAAAGTGTGTGTDHLLSDVLADGDGQELAVSFHLFGAGKVGLYGRVLDYLERKYCS